MAQNDLPPPGASNFTQRVRETLMVALGRTGDPLDRHLTLRDLLDSGVAKVKSGFSLKTGMMGSLPLTPGQGEEPDLTPPPTPEGFAVSAAISHVFIEHAAPVYTVGHGHLRTRVYGVKYTGGALPTFSAAVELGQFSGAIWAMPSDPSTTWRLWIKWETNDGVLSSSPAGGTNGLEAITGQDVDAMVQAMTGTGKPFTVLPTSQVIDGVTYPAGVYATSAFIMDAQITRAKIKNLAVDNAKIADLSVSTSKISDAAITNAKIGTAAVKTANIEDAAITNALIANAAISSAKVADAAITTAKIADAQINTAKIADAAITAAKIQEAEVGTLKIAGNAVVVPVSFGGSTTLAANTSWYTTLASVNMSDYGIDQNSSLFANTKTLVILTAKASISQYRFLTGEFRLGINATSGYKIIKIESDAGYVDSVGHAYLRSFSGAVSLSVSGVVTSVDLVFLGDIAFTALSPSVSYEVSFLFAKR